MIVALFALVPPPPVIVDTGASSGSSTLPDWYVICGLIAAVVTLAVGVRLAIHAEDTAGLAFGVAMSIAVAILAVFLWPGFVLFAGIYWWAWPRWQAAQKQREQRENEGNR